MVIMNVLVFYWITVKIYNLKEWNIFSQNNLPYNLDTNYCIFTNDNNVKINLIEHELSNIFKNINNHDSPRH